ncbi:Cdc6/Cdc18 family protein [Haloplanus ruber]|uniref:Cdc6/Cdc18 family protein n=1 Tax=Haloplanus ruber TaxID=869892 RepID=A0ABD6D0C6_9EURY|nr:Cdc6/Cdc18 family protein [Haloplanus ruber]
MIRDARALRDEFVPSELHHREGAIQHLSFCLSSIQDDRPGEDVLITGPSGAGKTTTAKYVVDELERETLGVRTGYANCLANTTVTGVLHALLRDAGLGLDLQIDATSTDQYLDRVRQLDDQVVIILDEVDVLADHSLLVSFFEIPNVTTVMICVDEDSLLTDLDLRVAKRVRSAASLHLEKYRHHELVDILKGRIDAGLVAGATDGATIDRIADLAAGDARFAITLLRRAAQRAEYEGVSLSPELVEDAVNDAEAEVHQRKVELLSTHQRLLYQIIREYGEIGASKLHAEYEERAQNPKSSSTRYRYLRSLEYYELIEKIGATRGSEYRVFEP